MAGSWTSERFPQFESAIRALAAQHRELEDEPLHLAISYGPRRDQQDIFLFEVVGGILANPMSEDRQLFEVTFLPSSGFPMNEGQQLHLVLTNPSEIKTALDEGWPSAQEIVDAVRSEEYQVLYSDAKGNEVLDYMRLMAESEQGVGP